MSPLVLIPDMIIHHNSKSRMAMIFTDILNNGEVLMSLPLNTNAPLHYATLVQNLAERKGKRNIGKWLFQNFAPNNLVNSFMISKEKYNDT
jgi:hypothetical protein